MSKLRELLSALKAASVWNSESLEPEDFKYRSLKRRWLPLFDAIGMVVGYLAMQYGSRILDDLYSPDFVDFVGITFLIASFIAGITVMFPSLWKVEAVAKIAMLALLGSYSATIWVSFFTGQVQGGFIAAILMLPLVMPLFRLEMMGEERKERKAKKAEEN